jgi:hypothetical protein
VTQQQLAALVPWTVEEPPLEARVGGLLTGALSLVSTVVTFGTSTGAPPQPTWDLPADPDDYVGLGVVRLRGEAPWLPGPAGARHRLRATQRLALVDDAAGRRPPVPVPLAELRVERARPHGVGRRDRRAHARWTLTLTGAGTVEVEGAWLALAWLGHLAGWPEPSAS